jgi:N utilization substance protein A
MDTSSVPGTELIQVADIVAREKSIDREEVIVAMEQAIQKAGRSRYGQDRDIRATIDRNSGAITLERVIEVVEEVEEEAMQITLDDAKKLDASLNLGDLIREKLPPMEFGRIAAQTAKQVISQRVRDAERARQFEEYKDRVGEIVVGTVKRAESYSISVDLGRAEGVIRRDEMIPRELLRQGDRVRAYIKEVREEVRGPQIFLSRAENRFMAQLFIQEVPEIYDGIIEIKNVVREAGSRAKIAVHSNDPSIDPVGACVGMRGSRVQAVVNELQGEKIEIIPWNEDTVTFAVNALAPAVVSKVVMDEDAGRMEVVVPDDQLSLAIGRRGQNVRLASQLTGWYIDILTEAQESERRQEETRIRSTRFMESLDIDDVIAHLLIAEGYVMVEDIAETPIEELMTIQGFDEDIATELSTRAIDFIKNETIRITKELEKLKVTDDLKTFEHLTPVMILALAENGILTLDDLAELDSGELVEFLNAHGLTSEDSAGEVIMAARAHWFEDEADGSEDGEAPELSEVDGSEDGEAPELSEVDAAEEK